MLSSTSNILYVRAALKPLARPIRAAGGVVPFLREQVGFDELLVPHFCGARPFWRKPAAKWPRPTNSGALGPQVAAHEAAVLSEHPSHAFAGFGPRVAPALRAHGWGSPCFGPIGALADAHDFSMLLLGCVEESPGFSTVHVAQQRLGLSQKHMIRLLLRWDAQRDGQPVSTMAPEAPGCSLSFDKFYPHYEADANLMRGQWHGVSWLWIPSARQALATETALLRVRGRFVDCGRLSCVSCRFRLY